MSRRGKVLLFCFAVLMICWTAFLLLVARSDLTQNILTPDKNGMIHHPFYGTYPAMVPYSDHMDLLPGQSTVVNPFQRKERK